MEQERVRRAGSRCTYHKYTIGSGGCIPTCGREASFEAAREKKKQPEKHIRFLIYLAPISRGPVGVCVGEKAAEGN